MNIHNSFHHNEELRYLHGNTEVIRALIDLKAKHHPTNELVVDTYTYAVSKLNYNLPISLTLNGKDVETQYMRDVIAVFEKAAVHYGWSKYDMLRSAMHFLIRAVEEMLQEDRENRDPSK